MDRLVEKYFEVFPLFVVTFNSDVSDFIFMQVYLLYSGIVSLLTFAVYGIDKARSKQTDPHRRKMRVPERVLLILAFAGGAFGASAGMLVFRHKTRKRRFGILIPISVFLWLLGLFASVTVIGVGRLL